MHILRASLQQGIVTLSEARQSEAKKRESKGNALPLSATSTPGGLSQRQRLMRRLLQLVLVVAIALTTMGADPKTQRFEKLGHQLVCTCGCNQILLECNHVGCGSSEGMRNDLMARLDKGEANDQILAAFSDKFGPTVLAAPPTKGFNMVAWVAPPIALTIGIGLAIVFVRKWRHVPAPAASPAPSPAELDSLRARARQETEI